MQRWHFNDWLWIQLPDKLKLIKLFLVVFIEYSHSETENCLSYINKIISFRMILSTTYKWSRKNQMTRFSQTQFECTDAECDFIAIANIHIPNSKQLRIYYISESELLCCIKVFNLFNVLKCYVWYYFYLRWWWTSCHTFEWNELAGPYNLFTKCGYNFRSNFCNGREKVKVILIQMSKPLSGLHWKFSLLQNCQCWMHMEMSVQVMYEKFNTILYTIREDLFETYRQVWVQQPLVRCFPYLWLNIDTSLYHVDPHHRRQVNKVSVTLLWRKPKHRK